ncbi:hypothetical protein T36_1391 [Helicobacter cinaedi]|uniref:hypothetical protein n=1 Tax=Helicobacter cinaedi TaxID=213 RepID=UPI001F18FA12|nr:hypothetical protein [Helicobacter cinaedi]BDB64933.1 hypothetical protein T36_1391 [Helicobacter cinaedi]
METAESRICVVFLVLSREFDSCASSFMFNKLLTQESTQPLKLSKNTSASRAFWIF